MEETAVSHTTGANKPIPLEIKAVIVRRRSMGKNLAFAHVKVTEEIMGQFNEQPKDDKDIIQIAFRRRSAAWDYSLDDTFPTKNSQLPYGAVVRLDLLQNQIETHHQSNGKSTSPKYEVRKWTILEDPREEAVEYAKTTLHPNNVCGIQHDGLSCSKYFTSRMNQYLKYNDDSKNKRTNTSKKQQPKNGHTSTNNQTKDPAPHGNKKHKALRAKMFASFLIDFFGREFFQNANILDIAGGKGQLSLELAIQSQSCCTIIDPLIRGKKDMQQYNSKDVKRIQQVNGRIPKHIAKCFVLNDEECLDLVRTSTIIVGLHPDECTEDILDAALKLNIPASIIPCCVFASLFPGRRLKNGAAVCSYEEFLDYLMEKDERIQRFSLSFEGKNQVLVFDPSSSSALSD